MGISFFIPIFVKIFIMATKAQDYEGFCNHIKEYEDQGLPVGIPTLARVAKLYNCPVPKLVKGELIFSE